MEDDADLVRPESGDDDDDDLTVIDESLNTSVLAAEAAASVGVSRGSNNPAPTTTNTSSGSGKKRTGTQQDKRKTSKFCLFSTFINFGRQINIVRISSAVLCGLVDCDCSLHP